MILHLHGICTPYIHLLTLTCTTLVVTHKGLNDQNYVVLLHSEGNLCS